MTFTIITHALLGRNKGRYYAYAPYVREMNIWTKLADKVVMVAPVEKQMKSPIQMNFEHEDITFIPVPPIDSTNFKGAIRAIFQMPLIAFRIFIAMRKADHIHLRCPGNIGLIGCIIQILFPGKEKTAKYAGNWDPKGAEPLSYRIQKWILNNRFLTQNITVLVYGEWPGMTENIKPFFTATYRESDKIDVAPKSLSAEIKFLFVGTLTAGKRPIFAIRAVEKLRLAGYNASLSLYGEGRERDNLEKYIISNNLQNYVRLMGAQREIVVRQAYIDSHFLLLPSKSEGWPKVVAEAMFWGCMPLATGVSCVPYMVGFGKRGMVLRVNLEEDVDKIIAVLSDQQAYDQKCRDGISWSRQFTLDLFEDEINNLMQK